MSRLFVYSDPHFGHENIIHYEDRPFKNLEEMDSVLINNWNQEVTKKDKVILLGDVSFYNKEKTAKIIRELNGHKFLIMGNHDRGRSKQWWLDVGFEEVSEYPIIYNGFFMLSHEPLYVNKQMPYVNIHGHTHNLCYASSQFVNVSVEIINYRPILLDQILARFYQKEQT